MHSKLIGKDSAKIFYNKFYDLIEPDCAAIVRYAHFDSAQMRFNGGFRDLLKVDTTIILAEGNYSSNGLKNGEFVTRYVNGNLQAKGYYKNGNFYGGWVFYWPNGHIDQQTNFINGYYDGDCMFYYENGRPNTHMKIRGYSCEILDAWNEEGVKIVNSGNGDYTLYDRGLTWQGKVVNGIPEGIWAFQVSDAVYGSELFEKGKFVKGLNHNILGNQDYNDKSRINFMPHVPELDVSKANRFTIFHDSPCDTTKYVREGNVIRSHLKIFD